MAEFKEIEVAGVKRLVGGMDADGVKEAEATANADKELVNLDIDSSDHANLTFAEVQSGDVAPVQAADPVNAGDNVNDAQGRVTGEAPVEEPVVEDVKAEK